VRLGRSRLPEAFREFGETVWPSIEDLINFNERLCMLFKAALTEKDVNILVLPSSTQTSGLQIRSPEKISNASFRYRLSTGSGAMRPAENVPSLWKDRIQISWRLVIPQMAEGHMHVNTIKTSFMSLLPAAPEMLSIGLHDTTSNLFPYDVPWPIAVNLPKRSTLKYSASFFASINSKLKESNSGNSGNSGSLVVRTARNKRAPSTPGYSSDYVSFQRPRRDEKQNKWILNKVYLVACRALFSSTAKDVSHFSVV
jgi:hypothetical protein